MKEMFVVRDINDVYVRGKYVLEVVEKVVLICFVVVMEVL